MAEYDGRYGNGYGYGPTSPAKDQSNINPDSPYGAKLLGNSSQWRYSPDGRGGVNYFYGSTPVTNSNFSIGSGQNYAAIEAAEAAKYPKPTGNAAQDTGGAFDWNLELPTPPVSNFFGSGGSTAPQYTAADERAAYDDQINAINRLLGYTDQQRNSGLESLRAGLDDQTKTLNARKARTMAGYDQQGMENAQDKERGVSEVDNFANSSYRNLQRLLQGGNAGNSSVGRELMPYLVSKAAGTRRQGVFETAGQNDQAIATARDDADYEYGQSAQDLENQRKSQEKSFLESIYGKQNELTSQRKDLEIKRAMANGQGYAAARSAGDASQASINDRMDQLASLFGQYKPTYNARSMSLKTPELSKFTVDKAALKNSDSRLPAESSYYLTQLKKKQELGL